MPTKCFQSWKVAHDSADNLHTISEPLKFRLSKADSSVTSAERLTPSHASFVILASKCAEQVLYTTDQVLENTTGELTRPTITAGGFEFIYSARRAPAAAAANTIMPPVANTGEAPPLGGGAGGWILCAGGPVDMPPVGVASCALLAAVEAPAYHRNGHVFELHHYLH